MKFLLENGGEYKAHGEQENVEYYLVGLHLKFVLENGGEHRAHGEQENGGIQSSWVTFESLCWRTVENTEHREYRRTVEYNLIGLHLKFVLENGGEHRAHREQENVEYYLVGLHLKVCAGERWRIQSTERTGERWNTI